MKISPNSPHSPYQRFPGRPVESSPERRRAAGDEEAARKADRDIDRLTTAIKKFQIDAQRFFAGDVPVPPDEQRERIQTELRRLRSANLKGAAASFRLGALEARFTSHLDLFGRRLRRSEIADSPRRQAVDTPLPDPVQGVIVGREADSAATEALYKGLYPGGDREAKMDLNRFRAYLDRQAETIRTKTGCEDIQFRVAVEDGKTKLKAKPIRQRS